MARAIAGHPAFGLDKAMCLLTSHEFLFFCIKQKNHHSLGAENYPKEPGG